MVRLFTDTRQRVFGAGRAAVALAGLIVLRASEEEGLITFKSKASLWSFGQDGSLILTQNGDGTIAVAISTRPRGIQLVDWGESRRIANRLFERMNEHLRNAQR